ncbi:MAG: BatD family protein [Sedimentisphaerales bacterium]|jgi:hypothetical protein
MRWFKISIFAAIAATLVIAVAGAAELRVYANVDTSKDIYAGEQFNLQIIIDGYDQPGQVDLTPLSAYNPHSAGGGNTSQTSISIINGRTTTNAVRRYVMNYTLTAGQAGTIHIPALAVTVDGKSYKTDPVELNVAQPGTTDQLELETTLSQQQCYEGQAVVLTVKFYVYANIGDYQFDIPAFNNDAFYVEDRDATKQYRVNRRNKEAILLTFSKVLIPKHAGDYDLGASSVSADVAVGRTRSSESFFEDMFRNNVQYKRFAVSAPPLKLSVLPLPQQDKPTGFYGLVGQYTISATAVPTKASVGDPITLTIKIGGNYLKPVQWPELEKIAGLSENFKMPSQKSSPTVENGVKVFTQTIRPANDKVTEIPSISLAYFDADKGKYVVAKTEPIKLEVSPTKILTTADVEGRDFTPAGSEVEAVKKGISANYEAPDCLQNVRFSLSASVTSPGYLVGWAAPLLLLVTSVLVKAIMHTTPEQVARKRRRNAANRAVSRLKGIPSAQLQNHCELIAEAMKQYIGERFDKVAGSLTADDCMRTIIDRTGDSASANRYRDVVSRCDAGRYAPMQQQLDSTTIDEGVGLIRVIEKESKI